MSFVVFSCFHVKQESVDICLPVFPLRCVKYNHITCGTCSSIYNMLLTFIFIANVKTASYRVYLCFNITFVFITYSKIKGTIQFSTSGCRPYLLKEMHAWTQVTIDFLFNVWSEVKCRGLAGNHLQSYFCCYCI